MDVPLHTNGNRGSDHPLKGWRHRRDRSVEVPLYIDDNGGCDCPLEGPFSGVPLYMGGNRGSG